MKQEIFLVVGNSRIRNFMQGIDMFSSRNRGGRIYILEIEGENFKKDLIKEWFKNLKTGMKKGRFIAQINETGNIISDEIYALFIPFEKELSVALDLDKFLCQDDKLVTKNIFWKDFLKEHNFQGKIIENFETIE